VDASLLNRRDFVKMAAAAGVAVIMGAEGLSAKVGELETAKLDQGNAIRVDSEWGRLREVIVGIVPDNAIVPTPSLSHFKDNSADLYDFAPVGYLTLDEAGLILEANLTAARQLGIPRSRLLNRPFHLLAAREDREKLRRHIRQVYQNQARHSTVTCSPRPLAGAPEEKRF
jgi:PAS domain-containing protein